MDKSIIVDKKNKKRKDIIQKKIRLKKAKDAIIKNIFHDKKIAFTGKMEKTRLDMKIIAIKYGAICVDSVSKNTDFLIVGKKPGSKLKRAKKLNVAIIDEKDFLKFLNGEDTTYIQLAF